MFERRPARCGSWLLATRPVECACSSSAPCTIAGLPPCSCSSAQLVRSARQRPWLARRFYTQNCHSCAVLFPWHCALAHPLSLPTYLYGIVPLPRLLDDLADKVLTAAGCSVAAYTCCSHEQVDELLTSSTLKSPGSQDRGSRGDWGRMHGRPVQRLARLCHIASWAGRSAFNTAFYTPPPPPPMPQLLMCGSLHCIVV